MAEALVRASGLRGYRDVLGELGSALDGARDGRGSAVVIRGGPGSGKSTLLRRTADVAVAEGWQVFQISGVPGGAGPPFSALRSLAYPVLNASRDLPAALRTALLDTVAGGVGATDALLAYSGLRQLLLAVARRRPTMVIVDDGQWLDLGSAKALAFLAHRLSGSRLALMAASPLDIPGPLDGNGTLELVLTGLDDRAADLLLTDHHPDLAPGVRTAVTATAQGNPLVLIDLPSALTPAQRRGEAALPDPLPVGVTVERALGGPFRDLSVDTRVMLSLLATVDGEATRKDVVSAAEALGIDADALVPAERTGLVTGEQVLRFSTPAYRCLAEATAPAAVRRLARSAWADYGYTQLGQTRDGQASAASGEPAMKRFDALARAALGRRDWGAGFRALQRAGDASTHPEQRSRRYAAAGEAALRAGRPDEALAVIRDRPAVDGPGGADGSFELVRTCAEFDTVCRVGRSSGELAGALSSGTVIGSEVRDEAALRLAETGSLRLSPEPARIALDWLEQHDGVGGEPLRIAVTAHLAPVTRAAEIRERLFAAVGRFHENSGLSDPRELVWMADAALRIDEAGLADLLVTTALRRLDPNDHSRIRHCEALQADLMLSAGRWTELRDFAASRRERTRRDGGGRHDIDVTSRLLLVYACQGRYEQAETLLHEVCRWGAEHGSAHHLHLAEHAALLLALARGDDAPARQGIPAPLPGGGDPVTSAEARRAYVDVMRAALAQGDTGAARDLHARASARRLEDVSAETSLAVRHGAALLAAYEDAADADERFRRALEAASSSTRPFARARLALDYGRWLRRQRETAAARTQLRASQDVFVRLGAVPWRDMALAELRAISVSARDTAAGTVQSPGAAFLSAQERRIARLAAQGLSNRQIADRLFISPRTVGSHLYKVYPRLGVSSRRELMHALGKFGDLT
ncbi:LuxR C-terminal-related transcriptional regulator [Streptomyces sp. JH14]|uniref:helix-turn-helix transcriptional regulator n=1 Tax=Streptomyces sp. JH14 TaxID=2793630 RepID=UPI0023F93D48|nr:LuxR family transcriptional regulator [Streptomyces sp. JH14]MDF6046214.1 LuxR C-terminal-related transcriptional regulator [Streptomyces sp. JH14]